jgi:ferritin-like metal-binding protein YciE
MTKKDKKRTGARGEPAKGPAVKDGGEDNSSAMADAPRIHAKEVFDSSKYNAMSDMTKASNRETKNVETLPDTKRITNSVNPEQIDDNNNNNNKSITTTAATALASASSSLSGVEEEEEEEEGITPKMTPMMVEERARTIREVKEEETHQHLSPSTSSSSSLSYQTGKEKKFVLYLNIMLSIENAAIERLHARIQQSPLAEVREQLVQHLEETREQKSRLITLINRLGGEPTNERSDLFGYSLPKVLADAFKASATTPEEQELRTMEADALIEHAEVIGYNMAIQLATKINIGEAIMPLRQNLQEEEKMVAWMRANLPSNFVQLWSKIDDEQRSQ